MRWAMLGSNAPSPKPAIRNSNAHGRVADVAPKRLVNDTSSNMVRTEAHNPRRPLVKRGEYP